MGQDRIRANELAALALMYAAIATLFAGAVLVPYGAFCVLRSLYRMIAA